MLAITVTTRLNPALGPAGERMAWPQRMRTLRTVWPVGLLFALVIGGMYTGIFSPNEAASVGAGGALIFAIAERKGDVAGKSVEGPLDVGGRRQAHLQ